MLNLSQLAIHPIKSCAQIELQKADISAFGLSMDRRWMLVDETGCMLTQRKHASMCLIQCQLSSSGSKLNVSAPGMSMFEVLRPTASSTRSVQVWNDTCNALDCGDEAANWFSHFLNTPARLVFFPDGEFRQCDLNYAEPGEKTAFSDGFPYLLVSQASLDDLNSRLTTAVEMKRFRANLVVSGSEAFAEDNWKRIRIGEINFRLVKPCSRCVIPSIDPANAVKTAEPLKTLSQYRMRNNKIFFGQNLIAEGSGELSIGMPVEILE